MGVLRKLFSKKDSSSSPGNPGSTPDIDLTCAVCAKAITDFHYSFESIMNAQLLGWQCPACGKVFCQAHVVEASAGTLCPECGGTLYALEAGPAYTSMVEAAQRNGRYNAFILAPATQRVVKKG